jgi:hypothetical protein
VRQNKNKKKSIFKAYFQNMKPSNYGTAADNYHENTLDIDYRNKMKVRSTCFIYSKIKNESID